MHSVVVGGSRGIGRVVARALAASGHDVTVLSRTFDGHEAGVRHVAVDLGDAAAIESALAEAGRTDNLICLQRYRGEDDAWEGELETSLSATRRLIDGVAGAGGGGSIVLVGSIAASMVVTEQPLAYHVAKAGLDQMVRWYAVKLGGSGWRVNGVTPGAVLKAEAEDFFERNPDVRAAYERATPLGRMGSPEDIADAVGFLCGERAAFVTGQVLIVDGGLSLVWPGSRAREAAET